PLTDEEKAALTQKLEKKCKGKVELSCEVDPSIMGGLIIEMQDTVIDGSLRQRLRDMKDVMRHE
ncbi:MAG: ATP synthase F1 subunit delta, partial [Oscillospiraceae bacterium]|nr:ATP synthase F1 subunit delta [Oscillospiraceae bacterium]